MNRRGFLKGLFTASAIVAVAPELLIPDGKVFIFPSNIVTPSYTIGQYADYINFSDFSLQTTLVTYYNKQFIENLKAQLPLEEMFKSKSLPPAGFKQLKMYQYQPIPA